MIAYFVIHARQLSASSLHVPIMMGYSVFEEEGGSCQGIRLVWTAFFMSIVESVPPRHLIQMPEGTLPNQLQVTSSL